MTSNEADTLISELTQSDGFALLYAMQRQWGWAGTMFTRDDVADMTEEQILTDEQWGVFKNTYEWRNLGSLIAERTWEIIGNALESLGLDKNY